MFRFKTLQCKSDSLHVKHLLFLFVLFQNYLNSFFLYKNSLFLKLRIIPKSKQLLYQSYYFGSSHQELYFKISDHIFWNNSHIWVGYFFLNVKLLPRGFAESKLLCRYFLGILLFFLPLYHFVCLLSTSKINI